MQIEGHQCCANRQWQIAIADASARRKKRLLPPKQICAALQPARGVRHGSQSGIDVAHNSAHQSLKRLCKVRLLDRRVIGGGFDDLSYGFAHPFSKFRYPRTIGLRPVRVSVCTGNPLGRIELRASSRPHFKFKLVSIYLRSLNFGGRNGRDFEIHNRYGD